MRRVVLVCAVLCAAACASTPPAPPPRASPGAGDDSELIRLADDAFGRGELDTARNRYQRVLGADPASERARAGLARVDLARGDLASARARAEAGLAERPDAVPLLVVLAEVERASGRDAEAGELLSRALALDPSRSEAHAALQEITGPAPTTPLASANRAVERAEAHPYDPRALFEAGRLLARAGQRETAVAVLEKVVWLADLDPATASAAWRLLARLDPAWSERRVVPVHVFADETVRAWPGWRFQLRTLWQSASIALDEVLATRFVPVEIAGCRTGQASAVLDAIQAACLASVEHPPRRGLVAILTGREPPRQGGVWKEGLAEFAGRRLAVRLEPDAQQSRALAHEILHIYGAVHVLDDVESLMNPSGDSMRLDRPNYRIARALRERRFDPGGFDRNVLPWIDLSETIAAYEAALALNLTYRKLGLDAALANRSLSRYEAARLAREAQALDPHLADVSRTLASLKLADRRVAEAVALLEVASHLYGPDTQRGRRSAQQADALRERLRRELGETGG